MFQPQLQHLSYGSSLMTNVVQIDIASTRFITRSTDVQVLIPKPRLYAGFVCVNPSVVATSSIQVRVALSSVPPVAGLNFDAEPGDVWRILRHGTTHYLLGSAGFRPGVFNWLAVWEGDLESVVVYPPEEVVVRSNGTIAVHYPIGYPHDMRMLMYHLAPRSGVVLHAAGVNLAGHGLLFPGRSGAGKSTLSRQFLAARPGSLLNDERIVARKMGNIYRIFGTPWAGIVSVGDNVDVPLAAVMYLAHGPTNQLRELKPSEAMARFYRVAGIPWYDELQDAVLATCADIFAKVPAFELSFRPTPEVVDFLADFAMRNL
jgi:hypothetical protein